MAKSYCVHFPNCTPLAKRFGVHMGILNSFINAYNMFLPKGEERISPEKEYTEEQLDEIYNKISAQRAERKKDSEYNAKQRAIAEKMLGGPEALAMQQATEVFTGKEIEEITQEIARLILTQAEAVAKTLRRENGQPVAIEDIFKSGGNKAFLSLIEHVRSSYYSVFKEANDIINGATPKADSRIKDVKQAREVRRLLLNMFMPTSIGGDRLSSMAVLSLNELNKTLGVRLHANFTLDESSNVSYELADSIRDVEEPQQDRWQQALDAQTLEGTISSIISRVLIQIPRTKEVVTVKTEDDGAGNLIQLSESHSEIVTSPILGLPLFSNIGVVAKQLSNMLTEITSEQDILASLSHFKEDEQFGMLYQKLLNDHRLLTTFFQDFNKYLQTCRAVTLQNEADGTVSVSVKSLNRGSRDDLVSNYFSRFRLGRVSSNSIFEVEETAEGFRVLNLKSKSYKKAFFPIHQRFKTIFLNKNGEIDNSIFKNSSLATQEGQLTSVLEALNFPINIDKVREILSDVARQDALISALNNYFVAADGVFSRGVTGIRTKMANNDDLKAAIGTIMGLVQNTPTSSRTRQVSYAGSTISSMILNSPYSILTKKLNSLYDTTFNGKEVTPLSNYLESKYLNSEQYRNSNGIIFSRWLADFMECKHLPSSTRSMRSIFGITRDLGIQDTKFEEINDQQHMLMFVMGYLGGRTWLNANTRLITSEDQVDKSDMSNRQVLLGSAKMFYNGKWMYRDDPAYIPSFITGDTNALRQISTIHYYLPEVLDGMYNLFLADRANQDVIKEFNRRGIVFSANGKEAFTSRQVRDIDGKKTRRSNENLFGILPFLNTAYSGEQGFKGTWYEYFNSLGGTQEAFRRMASEYLEEGFKEFKLQLRELGLLEKNDNGDYIYFKEFLGKNQDANEGLLDNLLFDFYYNYKFGVYNQAYLMQVNPLFFNGVEEYQKRNKGTLTNGATLSMEARDEKGNYVWEYDPMTNTYNFNSKVVYFKDLKVGIDEASKEVLVNYFEKIFEDREKAEKYIEDNFGKGKNSLTDGQAYRSFESYRKVLLSAGLSFWSEAQEAAYHRIMDIVTPIREARKQGKIASLTSEQIQEIEDLMVEMQPIKPINDGIESFGEANIKIGFQFKYAEVPLLPELFPVGSKLRELGDEMVDRKIDLLASDKCLKKGCFGEIDLQYKMVNGKYVDKRGELLPGMDENGKIIDDGTQTAGQQRANPQNSKKFVEWEDGTPVKDIFEAHRTGESTTEYIVHTIPMENYLIQSTIPDHTDGNSTLGTQGRKIGTGAIRTDKDYEVGTTTGRKGTKVSGLQLARIYGAAHAVKYMKSFRKFAGKLNNVSEAISDMIYNLLNNGRGNLAAISRLTLEDGENPTIPFGEPSNAGDIASNIISIFKKMVIRQLISGGSIVQASSMGYGKKALTDTGLHATIKDGIPTAMQTEMAFDFHYTDENGKRVPLRYEDYCDENGYFLDADGKAITEDRYNTAVPKIEIDYPGITDIIAYRIPTEMEYSMFHLKIVKCNPKAAANTIKLPAECTSIAGFDFDIDKLFLMRHNFRANPISNKDVWEKIYDENKGIREALRVEWEKQGRPEGVDWESYWDVANLDTIFGRKEDVFAETKFRMQKGQMQSNTIDYNMDVQDLIELSQNELDNLLIDCMVSILSDESTLKDRYTSGGFAQSSRDAKLMRLLEAGAWNPDVETLSQFEARVDEMEDIKPEYDYSEPMTSIIFKEQNQIAGTLIGIFANDSVNNFISKGLKTFRIVDPKNRILFGSLLDEVTEVDGNTEFDKRDIGLSFLHTSVNGVSVKRTLAELLAASVDAVKDPVLNFLNLNSITADAAAMLARLGYTTKDIGLLFNQPVIKEMCRLMNRTGEQNVRRALARVLSNMGVQKASALFGSKASLDAKWLSSTELAKNLPVDAMASVQSQIAVAQLFNSIMQTKQEFSNYVQQTRNTSANTVKSRFEDYLSSAAKGDREFSRISIETVDGVYPITHDITLEDLLDDKKSKELLEKYKDHPFIYENIVSNIVENAMRMMMDRYTVLNTPLYQDYRDILSTLTAPWGLGADQMEALHYDLPTILLSSLPGELNPSYIMEGQRVSNALRYLLTNYAESEEEATPETNGFIMQWNDATEDPEIANSQLTKILIDGIKSVKGRGDLIAIDPTIPSSLSSWEQFSITSDWETLMKKYPEAGKGLFVYMYYMKGLNPKYNRLMELAPVSVLQSIIVDESSGMTYADFFNREGNDMYYSEMDPIQKHEAKKKLYQFILAHNEDQKLVRTVDAEVDSKVKELIFIRAGSRQETPRNSADLVQLQVDKRGETIAGIYYAPIIRVNGMLYVMAKNDGGKYTIDYNNYKSPNDRTITYVPVSNDDVREDVEALTRRLFGFYNSNNGIIFNYNNVVTQASKVLGTEDIVTDSGESSASTIEEEYDDAKERTEDDEVVSSDGKPKCNIR